MNFTHAVESSMSKSFLPPCATEVQAFWDWWRQEGQGNIYALIFDNLSCAQLLMWYLYCPGNRLWILWLHYSVLISMTGVNLQRYSREFISMAVGTS